MRPGKAPRSSQLEIGDPYQLFMPLQITRRKDHGSPGQHPPRQLNVVMATILCLAVAIQNAIIEMAARTTVTTIQAARPGHERSYSSIAMSSNGSVVAYSC